MCGLFSNDEVAELKGFRRLERVVENYDMAQNTSYPTTTQIIEISSEMEETPTLNSSEKKVGAYFRELMDQYLEGYSAREQDDMSASDNPWMWGKTTNTTWDMAAIRNDVLEESE